VDFNRGMDGKRVVAVGLIPSQIKSFVNTKRSGQVVWIQSRFRPELAGIYEQVQGSSQAQCRSRETSCLVREAPRP
jgi:hypothetical protein